MIKYLLLSCFVLLEFFTTFSLITAQNITKDLENTVQENQIIKDARNAIKIENKKINSIYIKSNHVFSEIPQAPSVFEINLLMPDRIKTVTTLIINGSPHKNTKIGNGINYQNLSESEIGGEKIVRDITEPEIDKQKMLERLEGKVSKETLENFKKMKVLVPKELLNNEAWSEIFPFILVNPFEQNLDYKYVGKAESKGRIANIVDVKSKNERSYRLLFDSETNHLIMMIESFKGFDGDYEDKYYYSNHELVDNILIPKRIKVEHKFTALGKEPSIHYENIDILEFKLNPKFEASIFEIK